MADRNVKASKTARNKPQPAILAQPEVAAAEPVAFTAPEALVAPCETEAAPVEVAVIEAAAPVEVEIEITPAPVEAAAPVINQAVQKGTTMNEQINQTIEQNKAATQEAANRVQAAFGDINERSKTAMEKSAKMMEEMTDLARGNVEALVASSKVAARGAETLTQEAADFNRRSFEATSNALKSFSEVKSPTDFFRLQSEFARGQFDAMVAETSKMSEAMIKLSGEIAEPITSRYSVAAERVKTLAI
jgi:phasin family protein